jgi:hypothetical protein
MLAIKFMRVLGVVMLTVGLLCAPVRTAAQFNQTLYVDCSGNNPDPSVYSSISTALLDATDRTAINVQAGGICNESVTISDLNVVSIYSSMGFTLNGNLSIQNSRSVHITGVNVTNPNGDGITVTNSNAVTFEDCSSSNNPGAGLNIGASTVNITHIDAFNYNLGGGVIAGSNSNLSFNGWWPTGAQFEMIGNSGFGLKMDRSVVTFSGSTTISNTVPSLGGTFPDAFGIIGWGGAKAGFFGMTGLNFIANNQGGGVFLGETSELSMGAGTNWASYPVTVTGNGPYGAYIEFGSQLTVFGATQISDHTIAGIDVYSNSQTDIFNGNQITRNGTGLDPGRAGLRVDGNSQAYVRGTTFSGNGGPGILELVNSSVDLGSSTFSANIGGPVVCDGSAVLKSDVSPGGSANTCRIAPANGIQRRASTNAPASNLPQWKAYINKMHAYMTAHHK